MGIFDAISSKISSLWAVKPREFQEMLDVGHACMLTCLRKELSKIDASSNQARAKAVDKVTEQVEKLGFSEQQNLVQQNLTEQMQKMFEVLHAARSDIHLLTANATSQFLGPESENSNEDALADMKDESNEMVLDLIREKMGFCLRVKDSKIHGAGEGVFVNGMAEMGDVVAIYPGYVHLREHLRDGDYVRALFPDENFFLFTRYDSVCIDGRTVEEQPSNEFGLGHMVNHPPKNMEPNVIAMAYNFVDDSKTGPTSIPKDLRYLIPNTYFKSPTLLGTPDLSILMQCVVYISTRRIEDEEMLINYRFNPKFQVPEWYHHVDDEQAKRRWA